MSKFPDFADFFRALWKIVPFPWQTMLAERVLKEGWPDAIDLPTASGKTACLDIAVYALAAQVPEKTSTCARRTWFVVDRRIVVDEAFDRARKLAAALENSDDKAVRAVAERLLALRGLRSRERPLAVGRLRGGALRDDGWARLPSQPAVITSTVDQLGSRLLFRGYGHSALAAPIFAGLAANDSLVLLDEAHCAIPFLQTLRAVQKYRGAKWSQLPTAAPFRASVLSATPPGEEEEEEARSLFPGSEEERAEALDHPVLQERLTASKPAALKKVKREAELTERMAEAAEGLARAGARRIGVIANRVARAGSIAELLRSRAEAQLESDEPLAFEVELLTGRIRSVERDALVEEKLKPVLHSSPKTEPGCPLLLVSTQCLEVGADFSFDALVTECASLDALRQRFGRLARLGKPNPANAFVFVAEPALKESDPIYGDALRETWEFLDSISVKNGKESIVDFGFEALRVLLPPAEKLRGLLAPAPEAPILLPAHLDLLCQTAPLPHPDPDVAVFLHGKGRDAADARVAFRCDLDPESTSDWPEIVSLCRPAGGEMLSVPLHRLREWLRRCEQPDLSGDVEGEERTAAATGGGRSSPFVLCRGRDKSKVSSDPDEIFPNDVVILPAPKDVTGLERVRQLGQALCERGLGPRQLDVWELAVQRSGRPPMLRLHRETLAPWLGETGSPALQELLDLLESGAYDAGELRAAFQKILARDAEAESAGALPKWLLQVFDEVSTFNYSKIAQHPGGGIILTGKRKVPDSAETDYFADEDDALSEAEEESPLAAHGAQVAAVSQRLAEVCLGSKAAVIFRLAGEWHDAGKLDPRFQEILRGGAPLGDGDEPLAKSPGKPRSREQSKAVSEAARLPAGFRHEMLSLQMAEGLCRAELSAEERELFLHLLASHHGHARPFAPICEDDELPGIEASLHGRTVRFSHEERRARPPGHRLDSGVIDRFWTLVRRYGWWGLAYREALLRLADWYASQHPNAPAQPPSLNEQLS